MLPPREGRHPVLCMEMSDPLSARHCPLSYVKYHFLVDVTFYRLLLTSPTSSLMYKVLFIKKLQLMFLVAPKTGGPTLLLVTKPKSQSSPPKWDCLPADGASLRVH